MGTNRRKGVTPTPHSGWEEVPGQSSPPFPLRSRESAILASWSQAAATPRSHQRAVPVQVLTDIDDARAPHIHKKNTRC